MYQHHLSLAVEARSTQVRILLDLDTKYVACRASDFSSILGSLGSEIRRGAAGETLYSVWDTVSM
jgi:hypothetical protein